MSNGNFSAGYPVRRETSLKNWTNKNGSNPQGSRSDFSKQSFTLLQGFAGVHTSASVIQAQLVPSSAKASQSNQVVGESWKLLAQEIAAGKSLISAFQSLNPKFQKEIQSQVGQRRLQEFFYLTQVGDETLYWHGVLNIARSLQNKDNLQQQQIAGSLLGALADPQMGAPRNIQSQAQVELNALQNQGPLGKQIEALSPRILKQATDWRMVTPMVLAGTVYKAGKLWSLGKLAAAPEAWFTRGVTAQTLATTFGFAGETAFFSLGTRSLIDLTDGGVKWDAHSVTQDLLGAGLTLGLLKGTGALFKSGYLRSLGLHKMDPRLWSRMDRFGMAAQGQLGGYLGLVGAHHAEVALGLRPHVPGENVWLDALGTHLALQIGSHGGRRLLGTRYARIEHGLEFEINQYGKANGGHSGEGRAGKLISKLSEAMEMPGFKPALAMASGPTEKDLIPELTRPMATTGSGSRESRRRSIRAKALAIQETKDSLNERAGYALDIVAESRDQEQLDVAYQFIQENPEMTRKALIGRNDLSPEVLDEIAKWVNPDQAILTNPNIKSVLIPNRGEIAVRLSRTLVKEGIKPIVMVTELEAQSHWAQDIQKMGGALRVVTSEEVKSITGKKPTPQDLYSFTYLNIDRLVAQAGLSEAQAIHPGYGYLSENAEFAEKLAKHGIALIGPSANTMKRAGDKDVAKQEFIKAGVPVVPGTEKGYTEAKPLIKEIRQKGLRYPLRLKAIAGGGGRGQKTVYSEAELLDVFGTLKAEAEKAFGKGDILAEQFIPRFQHVEFQIMADRFGNVIHLGERECTLQIREQKLIEIHPAEIFEKFPGLQEKMAAASVTAAKAVGYTGHGTVEFMVDPVTGDFFAMEVNARIQVEHRVSEEIAKVKDPTTGELRSYDLIAEGLRVARGLPLSYDQGDITPTGAAIEVRIKAVLPAGSEIKPGKRVPLDQPRPGLVTRFSVPEEKGVFLETSVREGDRVSPYADPMIAKIIVTGKDRADALRRTIDVLEKTTLQGEEGFSSDLSRQLALLKTEAARKGHYDNRFVGSWTELGGEHLGAFPFTDTTIMTRPNSAPIHLEIGSHAPIPEDASIFTHRFLENLLGGKEIRRGWFKLQGPLADLMRQDQGLREKLTEKNAESRRRIWAQVDGLGQLRQWVLFDEGKPVRALLIHQARVISPRDSEFAKAGTESPILYDLNLEKGTPKGSLYREKDGKMERLVNLELDKTGENTFEFLPRTRASLMLELFPVPSENNQTALQVRDRNGNLLSSIFPQHVVGNPSERILTLFAMQDASLPENMVRYNDLQTRLVIKELSALPETSITRQAALRRLGTTPESIIAPLLKLVEESSSSSEQKFLDEIIAMREISGYRRRHEFGSYRLREDGIAVVDFKERSVEGDLFARMMIRAEGGDPFDLTAPLEKSLNALREENLQKPEARDLVVQVRAKRPEETFKRDEDYSNFLRESLNSLIEDHQNAFSETGYLHRIKRFTFIINKEGEYPEYFTFRRSKEKNGDRNGEFLEDTRFRGIHPMLAHHIELTRWKNFNLVRDMKNSDRLTHLYSAKAYLIETPPGKLRRQLENVKATVDRDLQELADKGGTTREDFLAKQELDTKASALQELIARPDEEIVQAVTRVAYENREVLSHKESAVKVGVDSRFLALALVPHARIDRSFGRPRIPVLESQFSEIASRMHQGLEAYDAKKRPQWNRIFINVQSILDITEAELIRYAEEMANEQRDRVSGLGLERVVVKALLKDPSREKGYRTILIRLHDSTGTKYEARLHNIIPARVEDKAGNIKTREVLVDSEVYQKWVENRNDRDFILGPEEWAPADIGIRPITPLQVREQMARSRGRVFAYRVPELNNEVVEEFLVKNKLQAPHDPADNLQESTSKNLNFVELDLDPDSARYHPKSKGLDPNYGELIPARDYEGNPRAIGKNKAGVVIFEVNDDLGLGRPVRRLFIMGDLTHSSRGSLSAEETARINAAIRYADREGIPIDWFTASSGAEIHEVRGVEGLDATATTARDIVLMAKSKGVRINMIVQDVNIGAQSYWNSLASIIHDTGGILVMTPKGSMALTGPDAWTAAMSSKIHSEDLPGMAKKLYPRGLLDLAGYETVHGPNGEAMAFAKDLKSAMELLVKHHYFSYAKQGEMVGKRSLGSQDKTTRDITQTDLTRPQNGNGERTVNVGEEIQKILEANPAADRIAILEALRDQGSPEPVRFWAHAEGIEGLEYHEGGELKKGLPRRVGGMNQNPNTLVYEMQIGGRPSMVIFPPIGPLTPADSLIIARAIYKANARMPLYILGSLSGFNGDPRSMQLGQLFAGASIAKALTLREGPTVILNMAYIVGGTHVVVSKELNPHIRMLALKGSKNQVIGGPSAAKVVFRGRIRRVVDAMPEIALAREAWQKAPETKKVELKEVYEAKRKEAISKLEEEQAAEFDKHHSVERAVEVGAVGEIISPSQIREALIRHREEALQVYLDDKVQARQDIRHNILLKGIRESLQNPEAARLALEDGLMELLENGELGRPMAIWSLDALKQTIADLEAKLKKDLPEESTSPKGKKEEGDSND